MEQLRQVGEVLGSLKALMIFRDDIKVNQRQCALLVDAFNLAFDSVADEIKKHLRLEERLTKWKALENPLRELHRVFREGEQYVRSCLEPRSDHRWGRAVALSQSTDCVELHLHNLLWCVPVVLEAVEAASETSGCDQEEMLAKRIFFSKKYDREWTDPKVFEHEFGRLYLVSRDMRRRLDSAPREDRWLLSETVAERRGSGSPRPWRKQESRLAELLLGPRGKLHQTSVPAGWPDFQVRRRLGPGSNLKEIQWMGESFAMKHAIGDVEQFKSEIDLLYSLAHPNVQSYMYVFSDEEKKECFMVMELMSKDLSSHIKEVCCARRRVPFPPLVAVDIMLQIARGMSYLHSRGIYHGDLNPRNILVKSRSSSPEGYMLAKIANVGASPVKNSKPAAANQAAGSPCIWYAPEVLSEQEQAGAASANGTFKYTEKADVYSFAMVCFELLTGKVPFDENHLQGDKMSRNIKADVRPLFPFPSPKCLVSLTKRCWQSEPTQRPSFASICRMLRYIKRFLVLNPDNGQPELPAPPLDYFDIETNLSRRFPSWIKEGEERVSDIPFQMYAYRVVERERTSMNVIKDRSSDSGSEGASVSGEGSVAHASTLSDDTRSSSVGSTKSSSHASSESNNKGSSARKAGDEKTQKQTGEQKSRIVRPPPPVSPRTRGVNSDSRTRPTAKSPARRRTSGHASDSELSL
ncbi:putative serine/threonine-protein kinase roco7 [Iris pallida]|uniref:Serine/threonine-protein kinase roco7 n=1 Tax=Iris pallida TaxID=29817 RepID=A0AAX6GHM7_IRIPA|nr:putative serine/threonine-protein kinase roco7 [Iris pallida]